MRQAKAIEAGDKFGRLTVLSELPRRRGERYWHCGCECGGVTEVRQSHLRAGRVKSCGCLTHSGRKRSPRSHGMTSAPEYAAWGAMIQRCTNPNHPKYPQYGGRGIRIHRPWLESFEAFYADMGPRPTSKHTIDREDNDGNYEPRNCRWVLMKQQAVNKSSNRRLTFNGETKTLSEWCSSLGLPRHVLAGRLRLGWSVEKALSTPPGTRPKK